MSAPATARMPPPPPKTSKPQTPPRPAAATAPSEVPQIVTGTSRGAERILLYGTGGIGKSTLAALLDTIGRKPLFLDCEQGSRHMNLDRIYVKSWGQLRDALHSDIYDPYGALVIDTMTAAEVMCREHVVANVPHPDKGTKVSSIEGFGFGKGYGLVMDEIMRLLGDCDDHMRAGRTTVLVCHDEIASVPNPEADDFIRYEPRLQVYKNGNVRARVHEWADHVLFLGYDVAVVGGKGKGSGTRRICASEQPTFKAKSRTLAGSYSFDSATDNSVWRALFNSEDNQ